MPGTVRVSTHRAWTISKIYVSSEQSAANGRRNWGIPKERCEFDVAFAQRGVDRVRAVLDGELVADFRFRASSFRLPVTTALLPRRWRTLTHQADGRRFIITSSASGWMRPVRLLSGRIEPRHVPDFASARFLLAYRVDALAVTFPPASVCRL